jgi:hypothetical protein
MNTRTTPTTCATLLIVLGTTLSACEEKGGNAPQATRETPQTALGVTAKMARDVKGQIEQRDAQTAGAADMIAGGAGMTQIGPFNFPIPSAWQKQAAGGSMRLAQFSVPGPEGAAEVVFFNIRGDARSNIERWKGQVESEGGQKALVKETQIKAGSLTVHLVVLEGKYRGMGPAGTPGPVQSGVRFLGAYVDGGSEPVQIRMTGPAPTVEAAQGAFEQMLAGIQGR